MQTLKTIVIGGGLMGLCTAWALVEQGQEVTLVEQGTLPNVNGASVDQHRVIRYPYGASVGYCRMVDAAFAGWEKLWKSFGQRHYIETGTLDLSCTPGDWAELSLASLELVGIPYQLLSPQEMVQLYPFLAPERLRWGLYVKRGGVLLAERIIAGLTQYLERCGAILMPGMAVSEIDTAQRQVFLANGSRVEADAIVIATGAWVTKLLPQYSARITPVRQVVAYFEPPPQVAGAWSTAPGILATDGDKRYVVPPVAGTGLKFAAGKQGWPGDPDTERHSDQVEAHRVLDYFRPWFVGLEDYRFVEAKTCYYAMTGNQQFIIEEIGERIWVIGACSGHGFKFGPAIGIALAETLVGMRSPTQLTPWAAGEVS